MSKLWKTKNHASAKKCRRWPPEGVRYLKKMSEVRTKKNFNVKAKLSYIFVESEQNWSKMIGKHYYSSMIPKIWVNVQNTQSIKSYLADFEGLMKAFEVPKASQK